ncbi:MAG: tagaturonate epimerase family protein [Verrucomicrobiota bacterium]
MELGKYSFGMGDRFTHQGEAQLTAIIKAKEAGVDITPVWNKSFREHKTVKTQPVSLRQEADAAIEALGFTGDYFVDADHINMSNVQDFLDCSNFFTIDVAEFIGKKADQAEIDAYMQSAAAYIGELKIPGIDQPFQVTEGELRAIAETFLFAVKNAKQIFNHIAEHKGEDSFVAEISMDEVEAPQTPVELFFILHMIGQQELPVRTIAPKFTGRFNKGVDYAGNLAQFAIEFEQDLLVIDFAVQKFGLPTDLKLSVHSGSDKFSIYEPMRTLLRKYDKGVHIKTAGTTWLEELIGLALSGDEGLSLAKAIYKKALDRFDELTDPYATVINVDKAKLPTPATIDNWNGEQYANALRHVEDHPEYNPDFRQLLHCGYKVAAEYGSTYYDALEKHREIIAKNVTENLFDRHIKRLFLS